MKDEHGNEIELRSGAMPEDWHEHNRTGYIPGGADAMAERLLTESSGERAQAINDARPGPSGLPQGYGDHAARDGYDARTGR